ncbi:QRFP-like peptide receptor isoform X2 [Actinia tenebrosa]|nr:QRFP-like peptide receptor isoform X2 [Actinia tenebrosa]
MEVNGTNTTLLQPCSDRSQPTKFIVVIQIVVYSVLLAFSFLGNSLVMLVVSRTNEIRATVNFFIFNMAVSDLIFTIVITPREITAVVSDINRPWFLSGFIGSATCKLCYFIQDVCTAVSMLTLVAIATDRYYAIVFPMRSGVITPKIRKVMVISIWIIAMGFNFPNFYAFSVRRSDKNKNLDECVFVWDQKQGLAYFLTSSAFLFILPLMTMIVIYSIILVTIRRRKIPGSLESSRARRHKERRNRRVLKMVLAVLLAFL